MYSFETAFKSFVDFIIKFFFTVFHPVFRSKQFITRTRTQSGNYINAAAFLYLTVFIMYYLHRVDAQGFLTVLEIKSYLKIYREFAKISLVDVLFISIPYAVLFYTVVWLLAKLLLIKAWRRLFIQLCIYWTCSVFLLLICLLVLLLIVLFVIAPDSNADTLERLMPEWLTRSLVFLLLHFSVLVGVADVLIISGIAKLYYNANRRLMLKLLAGLIIITNGIFWVLNQTSSEVFAFQEKLLTAEAETPAVTDKLVFFSNRLDENELDFFISKMPGKDSAYQIEGSVGVRNLTTGTMVLSRQIKTTFILDSVVSVEGLSPEPAIEVFLLPPDTTTDLIILKPQETSTLKMTGSIRYIHSGLPADSLANVLHDFSYQLSFSRVYYYEANSATFSDMTLQELLLHFSVR